MESTHTPGPWEVREDFTPSEYGTVEVYKEDGNKWIASALGTHVGPSTKEEVKANAYLIAAAPDLFEALRLALPYIQDAYEYAFPDADHNENVLTIAREALAKANGQPIPL
jgi:hypothetical protein